MMSKFISVLESLRPISLAALSINFFFSLGGFWLLFAKYPLLPPMVPLWFSKEWGASRLGAPSWLWLIPISSLSILFLNNILAVLIKKQTVVATILVWFATIFSLISVYSLYRLISLSS